jgi:hypothetical protein
MIRQKYLCHHHHLLALKARVSIFHCILIHRIIEYIVSILPLHLLVLKVRVSIFPYTLVHIIIHVPPAPPLGFEGQSKYISPSP